MTEPLRARPTNTFIMRRLSHDAPANNQTGAFDINEEISIRRAGSVHPNPHAKEGDGATGHRVNPAPEDVANLHVSNDKEDAVI